MSYKKITEHERFAENPFMKKAIQEIQTVRKTEIIRPKSKDAVQLIVSSDGELTGHTAFLKYVELDEEKFAKVYVNQFAAFWELSKPAIRVFGYILTILEPNRDKFIFRIDKCQEHTGYKAPKQIISGLSTLVECGIIARSKYDDEYYINPLIVFNGSRVIFAQAFVKKKKEEAEKEALEITDGVIPMTREEINQTEKAWREMQEEAKFNNTIAP